MGFARMRGTGALAGGLAALALVVPGVVVAAPQEAAAVVAPAALKDFDEAGVRIYAAPDAASAVNGLGYPGQGFDPIQGDAPGPVYQCGDVSTTVWTHGVNVATGVQGWVPDCNLHFT